MNEPANTSLPDLSSAISKIMEHPELISMVASVLGEPTKTESAAPAAETVSTDVQGTAENAVPISVPTDMLSSVMPLVSKLSALSSPQNGGSGFKHEQLLCALKPYLSSSRGDAVDYIIKISKMSTLLKGIK